MNDNNKKTVAVVVPIIFTIFIVGFVMSFVFSEGETINVYPIIAFGIFIFFISITIMIVASQKKVSMDGKSKSDYNHNKTFHKSEWDRLGLNPNDFKVDDDKFQKKKNKNSKYSPKQSVLMDYDKLSKEEKIEVDSILTKVLNESIDEEGKDWKNKFNERLTSSYDPTKDIKDETRTY